MRISRAPSLCSLLLVFSAAACGGGGGNVVVLPSAALSALTADPLSAPADGTTTILLTATIRDDKGSALAGRSVEFQVTGNGLDLRQLSSVTDAAGLVTATLAANLPGSATVNAVVEPLKEAVRLATTLTVDFTPVNAPLVQGPARFVDADGSSTANAGDLLVVGFSTPVIVDGAVANDFLLPVTDDSFGIGATVAAGPTDDQVTITLGSAPRLRTRGLFTTNAVTANEPSGIDVRPTSSIRDVATGTRAASSTPADIAPAPTTAEVITTGARFVTSGNFDNDGVPDFVVARDDALQAFVGSGALGFTAGTPVAASSPRDLASADINNFPNDELVTAHASGAQVWNNSGGATVSLQAGQVLASGDTRAVAFADIDDDGFPDVVTGSADGLRVFRHSRNLGNSFTLLATVPIGGVTALAAGDLDGDGDADVLAGLDGGNVQLLINNGGTLVGTQVFSFPGAVTAVGFGDLDGNGRLDVAMSRDDLLRIQFDAVAGDSIDVVGAFSDFLLVDVDGDSFADIVGCGDDTLFVLQNDRMRGFARSAAQVATGAVALATLDLDRDGDADFMVTGSIATSVAAGSLAGTFGDVTFVPSVDLGTGDLATMTFGDVDGDGRTDRLVGTATGVAVQLGDGAGGFVAASVFAASSPNAIALGDLDADGDLDAVLAFTGPKQVFRNDGAGVFTFALDFDPASITLSLALTDYDDDGDLDVVLGNDGANKVFENVSTTTLAFAEDTIPFASLSPAIANLQSIALLVHDVDRDGDEDIVVVNGGTEIAPQNSFLLKNGNGSFTLNQTFNAQLLATAAVLGDRDGDGRLDFVLARRSPAGNATLQLFRGLRTNFDTLPENIPGTPDVTIAALSLQDVDGDGRSDLVLANVGTPSEVWRQDATGTFALVQQFDLLDPAALHAADLDHDGDLDLVTLETAGPSRVLLGR